jgi:hypothetical protein
MYSLSRSILFVLPFVLFASISVAAAPPDEAAFETPEDLVNALYDAVTFEAGHTPDWDWVKSMFIDEGIVVLRTSKDETTIFSVEGFVADFVRFIEGSGVEKTGFVEKILRTKPMVLGDIAHVLVLYEAWIPGGERPPQQGVDSFQLIRKNGRWRIVSITNEIPTPQRPVPAELQK